MLVYLHIIPSKSNLPSEQLTPIPQEFNSKCNFNSPKNYENFHHFHYDYISYDGVL